MSSSPHENTNTHSPQVLEKIVLDLVSQKPKDAQGVEIVIRKSAGAYKLPSPKKSQILRVYRNLLEKKAFERDEQLELFLQKRAIRTASGVAVVALLTKPFPCPGKCVYCPTQRDMPKSYLSNQPAVMRAIRNSFDPYRQVKSRITALYNNGHITDKIELHITGGTWSFYPHDYQEWFIKRCFDAANSQIQMTEENKDTLHETDLGDETLLEAQQRNETTRHRIIGMTIETRPDHITEEEVKRLRMLGCTRIELGVQSLNDDVQKLTRREEDGTDAARATQLLRNAGFKVQYHMMPGLPGATPEIDIQGFKDMFGKEEFKPDQLKIYPCVVVKETMLYNWWKEGRYQPYDDETLLNTLVEMKKQVPHYVRIDRVFRDIPSKSILAGYQKLNLREFLHKQLKEQGLRCKCIRCRQTKGKNPEAVVQLHQYEYDASNGKEFFLSFENNDQTELFSFMRLRIADNEDIFIDELKDAALIRELHTYGKLKSIHKKNDVVESSAQHKGFGKKLLGEAERIAKQHGKNKLAIISGIGAREYYRKQGYRLTGTYMIKDV